MSELIGHLPYCTNRVAKTKALISFVVTLKLISASLFSHMQKAGFLTMRLILVTFLPDGYSFVEIRDRLFKINNFSKRFVKILNVNTSITKFNTHFFIGKCDNLLHF